MAKIKLDEATLARKLAKVEKRKAFLKVMEVKMNKKQTRLRKRLEILVAAQNWAPPPLIRAEWQRWQAG